MTPSFTLPTSEGFGTRWSTRRSIVQSLDCLDEGAEDHGSIVVGQLDKAGLLNETAELNEVTGSFTPRL